MCFVCSERRPANDGSGIKGVVCYNIFSVIYSLHACCAILHCCNLFFVLIVVALQKRSLRCQWYKSSILILYV